jgi:nucleotide-binding universal stress UspA family protein
MSYKTIVVHLDADPRREERLRVALELAKTHDAHVVGLFAPARERAPSYALAEAGERVSEIDERRAREVLVAAERQFRAAASSAGAAMAEWRPASYDPLAAVQHSARYGDLLVAGQPQPTADGTRSISLGFAGQLLLSVGRPVLFVPYAGSFAAPGKRVLVAWNASREAARAVSDALPLLRRAAEVVVAAFDAERSGDHGQEPGADIALYLARHGVKVTVTRESGAGIDVGNQIISRAFDFDSDLIVMGAYGHSRVRELMLGGATRTLLESMTVPVLMSH